MKKNNNKSLKEQPQIGILEWFRPRDFERVEEVLEDLHKLGITHLRTGVS